jgi:hypothetical protein
MVSGRARQTATLRRRRAVVLGPLALCALYCFSGCSTGFYPNPGVGMAASAAFPTATDPPSAASSAVSSIAVAPTLICELPLADEAALLTKRALPGPSELGPWPALSSMLLAKRAAAQLHVMQRAAVSEPKAPGRSDGKEKSDGSPLQQPRDLPVRVIPIENESALLPFHAALARLASGHDPDQRVRILAYGASHTQADFYPGYLRAYLQARFGDGGRGFVMLGRVNTWHSTLDTKMRQRGFSVHHARYRREPTREPLGLFGAALVGRHAGAVAELVTAGDSANTRFELQYYHELGGGDFDVQLDGTTLARITTQPNATGPGYFAFEAAPGQHRIQVRLVGNGPVRLFGVVAETAAPGIVLDTLGISGAQMADSLRWDDGSFIDAVRRRQPDLVSFAYGTNEAFDASRTIAEYEGEVRSVLARLRQAAPSASCLFIAPFDLPSSRRARLIEIVAAQRRLAWEGGCAFWNGYAFMGGQGSISSWASAKPSLAAPDHIHLTRRGYIYVGTAIADALLRAFDLDPTHGSSEPAAQPSSLLAAPSL